MLLVFPNIVIAQLKSRLVVQPRALISSYELFHTLQRHAIKHASEVGSQFRLQQKSSFELPLSNIEHSLFHLGVFIQMTECLSDSPSILL